MRLVNFLSVPSFLCADLLHLYTSEFCRREIPPPAGENAGVRDDAIRERGKFNLNHHYPLTY